MTVNRPISTILFKDLDQGDVFGHGTDYYMVIEEMNNEAETLNAVNLETGETAYFEPGDIVTRCRAEVDIT